MAIGLEVKAFLRDKVGEGFARSKYLLAVSGGLDSMVLLQVMEELVPVSQLVVAHYNHSVRGAASDGDQVFVQEAAARLKVTFVTETRPVGGSASEAALREDRHRFINTARIQHGCDFILTGHHLEDQFETFLMRLGRGTGLKGLGGIAPAREAWLRPLLSTRLQQMERFARARGISHREDETNTQVNYLRNRIRHKLAPAFFETFRDYGTKETQLVRFADLVNEIQEAEVLLDEQTRSLAAHAVVETALWSRVDTAIFNRLPPVWRRRVLRRVLEHLGVQTLSRRDLETTLKVWEQGRTSYDGPGFRLQTSCGYAYVQTPEQRRLVDKIRVQTEADRSYISDLGIALRGTPEGTEVRFFQPGDRKGGKKLKTFFLENRIPKLERRILPLLAKTGTHEVLWVFPESHSTVQINAVDFAFAASVKSLGNQSSP